MAHPGAIAFAAELATEADKQVAMLQGQLKDAQQLHRFLAAFVEALDAGHPSTALRVLAAHKKQLERLTNKDPDAASRIQSLGAELRSQVEASFQDLPRDFPLAIQKAGLALDLSSRHPKYTLLDEFIEVRFDKAKLETTVHPRDGRRTVIGIEPDVVVSHLVEEVARLTTRAFEPRAFLAMLATAYREVSKAAGARAGENVPLKDLVAALARDKNFRADEFNMDLSKLVRDKESAGKVALDNARDAKNGVLLWELDQRGYYGYIRVEG